MKLDYSEEEVRNVNLTLTVVLSQLRLELGFDAVDDRSILTLHVPQHVAVSLSKLLNQKIISSAPSTETVFAYLVEEYPGTQVLFWNNIFLDELLAKAEELHLSLVEG